MTDTFLVSESLKGRLDPLKSFKEPNTKEISNYLIVRSLKTKNNLVELELVIDDNWLLRKKYKIENIMLREKLIDVSGLEFTFKSYYNVNLGEYKIAVCKIVIDENKFWEGYNYV